MADQTFLVTDMSLNATDSETLLDREFTSERKAIACAKKLLKSKRENEVWIWKLSHVVSLPDTEPTVDKR